jgi:hypothetical protein
VGIAVPEPQFLEPISSFYGETTAVVIGLAAFACLLSVSFWSGFALPHSSLLFFGFTGLMLLHILLGRSVYLQQNVLAVRYSWCSRPWPNSASRAAVLRTDLASLLLAMRRQEPTARLWWLCAVLAILGIHSMLEYLLCYVYFLGIAAVALGVSETVALQVGDRSGGRLLLLVTMLFLAGMAAATVYQAYRSLQSLHRIRLQPSGAAAQSGGSTEAVLLELQQDSLFAAFVELALSRLMVLNREQIDDKLAFNGLLMRFAPSADVAYRQAILLALKGEQEAARAQWDLAQANYPLDRGAVIRVMEPMAAGGEKGVGDLVRYTMAGSAKDSK